MTTTFIPAPVTIAQVEAFVAAVSEKDKIFKSNYGKDGKLIYPEQYYEVQPGRKYARIVRYNYKAEKYGSAYCFIDMTTGNILKPAGFKAPAKHSRGNINTANHGAEFMGPFGPAYLR